MHVSAVVRAESLTKRFGEVLAVADLSFTLQAGTITGFLGPNGAGKTTTLRAPSGGRFTPERAADAFMGVTEKNLLAPVTGAMVLIAWLTALALIALPLITRRGVL